MSKNKTILIVVLLGIVSVITGFIITFVSNLKKDQKEMNNRISVIVKDYDTFLHDTESINTERDNIHKEFLDTIYYETFGTNDIDNKTKLLKYEENVTAISKKNKTLKEYCNSGVYYSSSDANNKCSAFNLAYEELINTFVEDINMYNNNIEKYNKWLASQENINSAKLEKYNTKKTYIDFNKDGQYSGREENNAK